MKAPGLSTVALLLLTAALVRPQQPSRGVAAKLLGTWNIVSGEKGGKKEPAERIKDTEVRITRDKIIVTSKDASRSYTAKYKLGLEHKPYAIVMKAESGTIKGQVAQGIFRLDGDRLTLCYALPGARAPDAFRTAPGDQRLLFVLQRAK